MSNEPPIPNSWIDLLRREIAETHKEWDRQESLPDATTPGEQAYRDERLSNSLVNIWHLAEKLVNERLSPDSLIDSISHSIHASPLHGMPLKDCRKVAEDAYAGIIANNKGKTLPRDKCTACSDYDDYCPKHQEQRREIRDDFDAVSARKALKPEAWEILKRPIVQSLLYDINLLPEQITTSKHWYYMLSVLSHMAEATEPVSNNQRSLFKHGTFTSHSGLQLSDKIECDALNQADWDAIAAWFTARLTFGKVIGIPTGGLALAQALQKYATTGPTLLVDDVLTTGRSMEEARKEHPDAIGAVLFSRTTKVPEWITARFLEVAEDATELPESHDKPS